MRAEEPRGGTPGLAHRIQALVRWVLALRYARFGIVGASGTVVNMAVLYLGQEVLFRGITPERLRLSIALAFAIFVATLNNFSWNRLWTWADRRDRSRTGVGHWLRQFGQYAVATWMGVALQYGVTLLLAQWLHYLVANLIAILLAAVVNFLANDRWTFRRRNTG